MKRWRVSLFLAGGALVTALPALSQQSPESLLPPGFGETPAPQPQQPQQLAPEPGRRLPDTQLGPAAAPSLPGLEGMSIENMTDAELQAAMEAMLGQVQGEEEGDVPETARRSPETVGPLSPESGGL